jgi:hypothetical protein
MAYAMMFFYGAGATAKISPLPWEVLRLLTLALDSYLFAILFAMLTTRMRRFSAPKGLSLFLSLVLP